MAAGSVTVPPSYLPSQQNSLNAMLGWLTGRVGETMGELPWISECLSINSNESRSGGIEPVYATVSTTGTDAELG